MSRKERNIKFEGFEINVETFSPDRPVLLQLRQIERGLRRDIEMPRMQITLTKPNSRFAIPEELGSFIPKKSDLAIVDLEFRFAGSFTDFSGLFREFPNLHSLKISPIENHQLTASGLADSIMSNTSLQVLDVSKMNLDQEQKDRLSEAVFICNQVRTKLGISQGVHHTHLRVEGFDLAVNDNKKEELLLKAEQIFSQLRPNNSPAVGQSQNVVGVVAFGASI